MKTSKAQLHRLIKLVGELKENKYPNCTSFAKKLRNTDINENLIISCSAKTIQRDINLLKEEYAAPIGYNYDRKGFYLKHHGWNFSVPFLSEDFLLSSILGAKVAENIIPEPLKSQIREAVDNELATNNPDFLDTALIETFIIASGVKVKIEPDIFKTIFLGWQLRNSITIKYISHSEEITERLIDPYIITYYNSAWYVKAHCHLKHDIRLFAIHRIHSAKLTDYTFETDNKIISESSTDKSPFKFEEVTDIEIRCSKEIAGYVIEQSLKSNQTVNENQDGSVNLYIPSIPKLDIIKWVLSEGGDAKVIKPEWLWEEIIKRAKRIIQS